MEKTINTSTTINTGNALSTFIRAFFEAFTTGVLDAKGDIGLITNAKVVKADMLNYYQLINQYFCRELYAAIARLNYNNDNEIEQALMRNHCAAAHDVVRMLQVVCRYDDVYQLLVNEYKRNFQYLLEGRIAGIGEHLNERDHISRTSNLSIDTVLAMLIHIVVKSYAAGVECANTDIKAIRQSSVVIISLGMTNLLLNEHPLTMKADTDLDDLFAMACGTMERENIVMNALHEAMNDLVQR